LGHKVIICARNEKDLKAAAQNPSAKGNISYIACDMGLKDDVIAFGEFVLDTFPHVDVLIHNAGVFVPGSIQKEEDGAFELLMDTNVGSAYHLTRILLPSMIERSSGHIFTIGSTASITAYTNGGSYCISKFALHGFTKVLREELKPHHIKVTSVLPGATYTNSWVGVDLPESRFIQANDIAEIIYQSTQLSHSAVVEEILIRPMKGDITLD
jgi:NADP-dependent 3-hydroxy acid dehydrogenase YdfG